MGSWTSSKLKSFVEYSLSKGATLSQVKEDLLRSGWSKKVVTKIFLEKSFKKLAKSSIIRVDALSKSFDNTKIIDSISFDIKPKEIFGIIGLSGSGKTTLLNLMVGFLEPDSGDASIRSRNDRLYSVYKKPELVKSMIGFATQEPSFYSRLTVKENLSYFASLYGFSPLEIKKRISALMRLMGLSDYESKKAKNLSGGMQKRLDIACALVHNPKILILDEPTADLDTIACEDMWHLLKQIKKQGTTVIIASHFLDELEEICDRIAVLHGKRVVDVGSPDELRSMYSKNYELNFKLESGKYQDIIAFLLQNKELQIAKTMRKEGRAIIHTPYPKKAFQCLSSNLEKTKEVLVDAYISKPSLKEYFGSLVKR
jgi:ABC-2 type transport system ATP-binding protein